LLIFLFVSLFTLTTAWRRPKHGPMNRTLLAAGLGLYLGLLGCGKTHEQALESVGETMVYNATSFTVKAGQKVHVTLKNNGTTPAMVHNFVLVKPGSEEAVAQAGAAAGEASGYVKAGDANVLASSPLAKPQQTIDFSFTAPAAGKYPFICTFPGHYQTMKGTLTVE
jgi:azurin